MSRGVSYVQSPKTQHDSLGLVFFALGLGYFALGLVFCIRIRPTRALQVICPEIKNETLISARLDWVRIKVRVRVRVRVRDRVRTTDYSGID